MDRRQFLAGLAASSLAAFAVPSWAAPARRLLILVELKGGNDGLNTLVPFADPAYRRLRPRLAIAADEVLRLGADGRPGPGWGLNLDYDIDWYRLVKAPVSVNDPEMRSPVIPATDYVQAGLGSRLGFSTVKGTTWSRSSSTRSAAR